MAQVGDTSSRRRRVDRLVEVPAVLVTFLMMLHVTANALLRTFASAPLPVTLEVVQSWYLPVVALLGFVIAQRRREHVAADLIFSRLPHTVQPYVVAVLYLLCSVTSAGFAWYSWPEAIHAYEITMTAGATQLISWPVYFLPPLVFGILTVQFALVAVRAIAGARQAPRAGGRRPHLVEHSRSEST